MPNDYDAQMESLKMRLNIELEMPFSSHNTRCKCRAFCVGGKCAHCIKQEIRRLFKEKHGERS